MLVAGHDEERQQGERPRPGAQRGPVPLQGVLRPPPPQRGAHHAGAPAARGVAGRALGGGRGDGLLDVGHGARLPWRTLVWWDWFGLVARLGVA